MTGANVVLRPEKQADLPFLRKLYATSRVDVTFSGLPEQEKQHFIRMQFDAQRKHYRTYYSDTDFLIIEEKGRPIGRLYLSQMAEEIRVMDITLMPSHRGKGIGGSLLRSVQDDAKLKGLAVTLHAEKLGNMAEYYKRFGFEVVGELDNHFFMKWTNRSSVIIS